jgi:hypothetical protein
MVMDFSWGWVKPGTVMTEPQAKVRLELARPAMPQAMRHRIAGSQPRVEGRQQGSHERLRLLAFPA